LDKVTQAAIDLWPPAAMRLRPSGVLGPVDSPLWKRHRIPGYLWRSEIRLAVLADADVVQHVAEGDPGQFTQDLLLGQRQGLWLWIL
jgi:hypothetical protein